MTIEKRIHETLLILKAIGFPLGAGTEFATNLRQRRLANVLMGVANLRPDQPFSDIRYYGDGDNHPSRTRDIIKFINAHYGETIADSSYDDIRRKNLDFLVEAGIVTGSRPGSATNDGTRGYAISADAANLFKTFGNREWKATAKNWIHRKGALSERLARPRQQNMAIVKCPGGNQLFLSEGKHNELQKAIVEEFLPRFLVDPELLYIGDTAKKILIHDAQRMANIGLPAFSHDILPDVVAIDRAHNRIFFIEAVYSANPISRVRHLTLEKFSTNCPMGKIYVSAFPDRSAFRRWIPELSWETEVWLASDPSHMIHFNGDKFLGPHDPSGHFPP